VLLVLVVYTRLKLSLVGLLSITKLVFWLRDVHSKKYGTDYEEVFALVAKMTNIRTLIVVASINQWHIS